MTAIYIIGIVVLALIIVGGVVAYCWPDSDSYRPSTPAEREQLRAAARRRIRQEAARPGE